LVSLGANRCTLNRLEIGFNIMVFNILITLKISLSTPVLREMFGIAGF